MSSYGMLLCLAMLSFVMSCTGWISMRLPSLQVTVSPELCVARLLMCFLTISFCLVFSFFFFFVCGLFGVSYWREFVNPYLYRHVL